MNTLYQKTQARMLNRRDALQAQLKSVPDAWRQKLMVPQLEKAAASGNPLSDDVMLLRRVEGKAAMGAAGFEDMTWGERSKLIKKAADLIHAAEDLNDAVLHLKSMKAEP